MNYRQHPLSAAFPSMGAEDFQALKDSIESIGVQNPVALFEGMVIDGWHRYQAATALGLPCPTIELGDTNPQDFVIAQNKARRHITQSQLALSVAAVYEWVPVGANQHGGSAPSAHPQKTTEELANIAGVSKRTMAQAKVVEAKSTPEIKEAVKAGVMSVKKAAEIVAPPKAKDVPPPAPEAVAADEPEDDGPSAEELAANAAAEKGDREALEKLLESDDKLATAYAEIKRLNAELAQMRISRDGYMNKCNEAIALVKSRDRTIAKLERQMKESA